MSWCGTRSPRACIASPSATAAGREPVSAPPAAPVATCRETITRQSKRTGVELRRKGDTSGVERLRRAIDWLHGHRPVLVALQLTALTIVLVFFYWAFRDAWHEAKPLLREADVGDVVISSSILAAYYLLFTIAWQRMLAAWGLEIPYLVALQAEMASIRAKYVPGTVWIPAARIAALRRFGVRDTPLVLASMLLEAGLSGLAGVLVFFVSLISVGFEEAPVLPLLLLGVVAAVGVHTRI